jgi:hypothetical protein
MIAFDISVNGKRICLAGNESLFSAILSRVEDGTDRVDFNVTGMLSANGNDCPVMWNTPELQLGDEVTIRIIQTDSPDNAIRI